MKEFIMRHRKILMLATIIFGALVIMAVGGVLFWNAGKTTTIDLQYNATKLDGNSEEAGVMQMHIQGNYRDYLFREDQLELTVSSFDGLDNIRMKKGSNYVYFSDYGCVLLDTQNSLEPLILLFDKEFDKLIFLRDGEVRYVGSVSGEYTVQECVSFFGDISDQVDYATSTLVDLRLDTVRLNKNGEKLGEQQFHITGYYRDYLLKDDPIYLEIEPFEEFVLCKTAPNAEMELIEMPQHNVVWGIIHFTTLSGSVKEGGFWLLFTEEFDRFMLINNDQESCYVGSVSGNYTTYEIVEYFNSFWVTGITLPEK